MGSISWKLYRSFPIPWGPGNDGGCHAFVGCSLAGPHQGGRLDRLVLTAACKCDQLVTSYFIKLNHEQNYGHVNIPHPSSRSQPLNHFLDGTKKLQKQLHPDDFSATGNTWAALNGVFALSFWRYMLRNIGCRCWPPIIGARILPCYSRPPFLAYPAAVLLVRQRCNLGLKNQTQFST